MQRSLTTLFGLLLGGFGVFGYLASFEPGVPVIWRIGYGMLLLLAACIAVFPWIRRGDRRRP